MDPMGLVRMRLQVSAGALNNHLSKKSPTGPRSTDPEKTRVSPSSTNLLRGPLGFGPIQFLMEFINACFN